MGCILLANTWGCTGWGTDSYSYCVYEFKACKHLFYIYHNNKRGKWSSWNIFEWIVFLGWQCNCKKRTKNITKNNRGDRIYILWSFDHIFLDNHGDFNAFRKVVYTRNIRCKL